MLNQTRYSIPHKVPLRLILLFTLFSNSCIVPYEPEPVENEKVLIVSGTITDQPGMNTIMLTTSFPVKEPAFVKPLQGCTVWISDEMGKIDTLKEVIRGTYGTDSVGFRGQVGKIYTLHIRTNKAYGNLNFESYPMEMITVPEIDSIYYEKRDYMLNNMHVEGCNIYLDAHDIGTRSFFRWEFSETWEFHLPFDVKYKVCWFNEDSKGILIKNSAVLENGMVERFPIHSIINPVDRLKVKYSMLVRQYSLNEDEYLYWDRVRNISEQVGSLYDLIPSSIPNNLYCIENPDEKILGYFSVSATTSKRIFIKDNFKGQNGLYAGCISDTLYEGDVREDPYWVLFDRSNNGLPYKVITYDSICADCRSRGTDVKPSFWDDDK